MRQAALNWVVAVSTLSCGGQPPPETFVPAPTILSDVVYGRRAGLALTLNVLQPVASNGLGVMFINSGGYGSPFRDLVVAEGDSVRLATAEELATWPAYDVHPLLAAGYTIFDVHHGSSPPFSLSDILEDLHQAVRFLEARGPDFGVDETRLGLLGHGTGAHLALLLATKSRDPASTRPDGIAAVVAYAGVSDLAQLAIASPRLVERTPALQIAPTLYDDYSPLEFATPGDPATLLLHGAADTFVPILQSQMMYDLLSSLHVPTRFEAFPDADHTFQSAAAQAAETTISWFDQHLVR